MKNLIKSSCALLMMVLVTSVQAANDIQLKAVAEVEVTTLNDKGEKEVKRVPASKVVPGTEVIYTITANNVGNNMVNSVVVTDPIPENTIYVDGSAFGAGTTITFSVDGGKKYDVVEKLFVIDQAGKSRPALATDYTNIRWLFNFTLKPGDSAPVWFKARLR